MTKLTVFLHVEKTGGMSFEDLIANNFREGTHIRYPRGDWENFQWDRIRCIYGHFHINWPTIDRDFPGIERQYFTFLRHPIERVWSHYHHTHGPKNFGNIRDWLEARDSDGMYYRAFSNRHTYTLTGHKDLTEASLDLAKWKLQYIDFGITEYFYNSIAMFKRDHPEIFSTLDFVRKNDTKDKGVMTEEDRVCIAPYVQFDLELYQEAKKIWWGRYGDGE